MSSIPSVKKRKVQWSAWERFFWWRKVPISCCRKSAPSSVQKNLPHADHFSNPQWLARLALLTNITTHLNGLNMKLQGKDILVTDLYTHITAFKVKLRLWEGHAVECWSVCAFSSPWNLCHWWHRLGCLCWCHHLSAGAICLPFCRSQTAGCGLQAVNCSLAKFRTSTPLTFCDFVLPSCNFPNYIAHAQQIVAMFGSTYCCEQLFSKMRHTKSRLHSKLSDRHLNDILLLSIYLLHRTRHSSTYS